VLALRRDNFPFADKHGQRLTMVPFDLAVGEDLAPGPEDVILSAGCDWIHKEAADLGALKRRAGFRLVVLCYDIIPLLHPEFFPAADVARFRAHWLATFPIADCVVFNARRIEADARAFCVAQGIRIGPTQVVQLGYEPPPRQDVPMRLRDGLEPGRFALFVSTIEPRKGHRLLVDAWRQLLARGVPQRQRFKLVFVGRRGWMVDALLREIDDAAAFDFTLRHYVDMDDDELAAHYRAAAFCLYPSVYEGFGLPIIEAFAHGKAVIASTGGAVPETVGGLSPCLDVADEAAWVALLERWIEDPQARAGDEARIRQSFAHARWEASATALLATAEATRLREDGCVPA
jgi:glycosyltransferase involved in cell wall biosynthesis